MQAPANTGDRAPDRAQFVLSLSFNAIPLAGVLFWGWSAFELIFLYWLENVAIGVRTFLTMLLSGRFHGYKGAAGLSLFFSAHYGIFCTVHGAFVVMLFGGALSGDAWNPESVFQSIWIGAAAIALWQGALLAMHLASGDQSTPMDIMKSPYPRIIALHLTIMAGGFLLMAFNWPHAGVVVLALVKTAMDAAISLRGWRFGEDAPKTVSLPPSRGRP